MDLPESNASPLILAFIADLNSGLKVESAAQRLGFHTRFIESAQQLTPQSLSAGSRQLAEHLQGPGAVLIDRVSQWKPALMIFDLGNAGLPWREWIALLTSAPATRRIPVICFGSHVDVEAIKAAQAAGAQAVLARSRFFSALPEVIGQYARIVDREEIRKSCAGSPSAEALRGLEQFNRGEYFEAHESLEHAWMQDGSAGREVYRAVLQIAVAYYQIQRQNFNGAAKMFLRVRQWIDPLPDECRGIDIARLRQDALAVHQALLALGPERIADFDAGLLRPVRYVPS